MPKYFGTDGFRGEAGVVLTAEHAFKIGRFIGHFYSSSENKKTRIIIGKDTRCSGDMLEAALGAGITSSGADVYLMGITTTPSVSYVTGTENFDCGIMISASHNPYYDNGIKLINGDGEKMQESVIEQVEAYIDGDGKDFEFAKDGEIGRVVQYGVGVETYEKHLISSAGGGYKGMKIAIDCANGSAYKIGKRVFEAMGAKVLVINDRPDGMNINSDCGSTHIGGLCEFVVKNKCDMGFAFDGDADRCLAVDENGKIVDGDHIMYICGRYMKEKGLLENDTIVTTVMSNFGLYKAFDKSGIKYEKTDVGDKYVYENMKSGGHILGGEQSGHIIFMKHAHTGDGILTALNVTDTVKDTGKKLSELASPVVVYPQVLKNVIVTDKDETLADPCIKNQVMRVSESLGDNGRILLRKSGTEPVLRVMVEAASENMCEKYADEVIEKMAECGYLIRDVK